MENGKHVDDPHIAYTNWARAQGVEINGVKAAKIPGRGMGLVAERRIEAGEDLVRVPSSALFSIRSVPKDFRDQFSGPSIQGILAAFLAYGGKDVKSLEAWRASWPSFEDMRASIPAFWKRSADKSGVLLGTEDEVVPLPPSISGDRTVLTNEREASELTGKGLLSDKMMYQCVDRGLVARQISELTADVYDYHWYLVNSRTFYYEFYDETPPEDHNDRIVMVPFMDYFNHADHGCAVAFDPDWYTVTSDRVYEEGEEIFTSYGSHTNEFLLVEYGFILSENKWDSMSIDCLLGEPQFPSTKHAQLKAAGYWGNYTLNNEGVCHRTQVAVRALLQSPARWKRFVRGQDDDNIAVQRDVDRYIVQNIIIVYHRAACRAIAQFEAVKQKDGRAAESYAYTVLLQRWVQIRDMLMSAFRDGIRGDVQAETQSDFESVEIS